LPDATGLQARLKAAERLIGELREAMALMAGAHRRELEACGARLLDLASVPTGDHRNLAVDTS
jgi:hypothetical protein